MLVRSSKARRISRSVGTRSNRSCCRCPTAASKRWSVSVRVSQRLRSTDTVSTSTRSGAVTWSAARNSPRAASPAAWSSARALARMEASTTITARSPGRSAPRAFLIHVGHGRLQADATAVLRFDLVEDLADRALLGEVTQLDSEVLLQRLVAALGLALQSGVHVLGDITDQNMRHACIMLTDAGHCKGSPARAWICLR